MRLTQIAWCALAYLCIGLGIAGIVLPLVPTTPFLLLALWAATRGSPRMAHWLYHHPRMGPYLHAWHEQRAIPKRAKIIALVLLATSWLTLWASGAHHLLLVGMAIFFVGVASFIVTRPTAYADQ
ncbi:YbaN family protein [Halomonas sp. 18H]|nr:YbaN family protein [Halomonas sp. 18H]MCW4148122.1 YbaN family protein [Halomonas sp. 18H]